MKIRKIDREKITYYLLCLIHICVSKICNRNFFECIYEGSGTENFAYKYFSTGNNMAEDNLSKILEYIYSHFFMIIFVLLFWKLIFFIVKTWKEKKEERIYIVSLLAI